MQTPFNQAAVGCCGLLLVKLPMQPKIRSRQTIYYYRSISQFTRDIRSRGVMTYVDVGHGNVHYTRKNTSGKRPTKDSELVAIRLASAPTAIETSYVIDREAFDTHQLRRGIKMRRTNVVVDVADLPLLQDFLYQRPPVPVAYNELPRPKT